MREKRLFVFVGMALLMSIQHAAQADAYTCQQNGRRFMTNTPCPSGSHTINVIQSATAPLAPDYPTETPQSEMQRQLDRIRQNRAEIHQAQGIQQQTQPQPLKAGPSAAEEKAAACDKTWASIRSIDAAARMNSTDWLRAERQRLMDVRWRLNC